MHFELIKDTEKSKSVFQISTLKPTSIAPKKFCKNVEYIEKSLTINYTNQDWIKYFELRQKYILGQM